MMQQTGPNFSIYMGIDTGGKLINVYVCSSEKKLKCAIKIS